MLLCSILQHAVQACSAAIALSCCIQSGTFLRLSQAASQSLCQEDSASSQAPA